MEHQILRFFIHDISLYASVTNCVQIYIMRTRRILSSKETAVQNSYKTDRLAQIEGHEQKDWGAERNTKEPASLLQRDQAARL